ncbi:hypothetical protein [Chamaesiphon sp. VAR_48_metabat_403]|uniref:hypothetical protein n=1 Tax=Chamaesiphon sp. VAR_48_metabat_403 TaxID=2964700 RepID=UPI00286EA5C1|nr:hypothetical protein [Chamaesiphon sp. VAR_48_metabat_403]
MKLTFTLGIVGCMLLELLVADASSARPYSYETDRRPQTCPSRVTPRRGAISVEQAKMYFYCDQEKETGTPGTRNGGSLWLIDNLNLQVASRPRAVNRNDLEYAESQSVNLAIDTQQPVYDIKASFIRSICHDMNIYKPGKNCLVERFQSSGICFRTTFDDWHCRVKGSATTIADREVDYRR